ncbi:MAG: manganese efflux pump [Prevotella sp.]|nr:manganese efflux pump [Prevotella sp.]
MSIFDIWLLAVALAMDCLAISIVSGVIVRRVIVRMALLFGLFQGLMPVLGWLGMSSFSQQLEAIDHWIAFGLLVLIGGNMIREAVSGREDEHFNPLGLSMQLMLAVATSIDALAIGISMACTGYHRLAQLAVPVGIIGLVSLVFSLVGQGLGIRFGQRIAQRLKPELLGGIILILIGVKILVTHI